MASDDPRDPVSSTPRTPRWVKVFGAILAAVLLLFVALQLAGVGGTHGPGRHGAAGDGGTSGSHSQRRH